MCVAAKVTELTAVMAWNFLRNIRKTLLLVQLRFSMQRDGCILVEYD